MTDTTKTIFEKYEVRKSNKQKTEFINWIKPIIEKTGYKVDLEKGLFGARNIVIGNPDKAKIVYTAHYDTCAALPFPNFITPKNLLIHSLYLFSLVISISALFFILMMLLYILKVPGVPQITEIILWALIALMLFGPANKHTANDNTSGVTVILDIINAMPKENRQDAAFILFDLEEAMLLGSTSYRLKHNKMMKNKLLINFDCVSDGDNILIAVKRKAKQYIPALLEAFKGEKNLNVEITSKNVFYPSDQELFPCSIAIAALKRTKFFKILYMNRIHTKRDVVYEEENIEYLVKGATELIKHLDSQTIPVDNIPHTVYNKKGK